MGKQFSWAETRESAVEAFGGRYPDAELEGQLLEVFRERPAFVVDAITDVKRAYEAGRIHSPWPFLRKRVSEVPAELVVSDESEKARKVSLAEQWLRAAGLHFDRLEEVEDELFGELGRLRAWATDKPLRERLLGLWRELRPRGEQAEREVLERVAARRAVREELAAKRAALAVSEDVEEWAGEESAGVSA